MKKGILYGVGIGPGDKELLTLKAVKTLESADVIALPDSLSSKNRAYEIIKDYINGKEIIGASLIKEIIHLRSDLYTKHSLPIPIISIIDPKIASTLAELGLDMANIVSVGKQATYATLINTLIAMVHSLCYDGDNSIKSRNLYEVKTRKIIDISNAVAASSNIFVAALTEKFDLLDVGGIAVAIHRLITDQKFIYEVKRDFIFGSYNNLLQGDYLRGY